MRQLLLLLGLSIVLITSESLNILAQNSNVNNATANNKFSPFVKDTLDVNPEFPGGIEGLYTWLAQNISYPEEAAKKGIQGRVFVEFVVKKTGHVEDVKVVRRRHPLLDKEAKRVIESMPDWKPGKINSLPVNVILTLPVTFRLTPDGKAPSEKYVTPEDSTVYSLSAVDAQPEFPGGKTALYKWIYENINFPATTINYANNTIRIIAEFEISKNGEVEKVHLAKGCDPALNKEVLRVINDIPQWKPALKNGAPVRVSYTLPIGFKSQDTAE